MEMSANNVELSLFAKSERANEAEIAKFIANLKGSKLASQSEFLATLSPTIRDFIVRQLRAVVKAHEAVKAKALAVSKLPSDDADTLSHIPNPLRFQNIGLKGSEEARGKQRFGQLQEEADQLVARFQLEMAKKYQSAAELELELKHTKLRVLIFQLAMHLSIAAVPGII